MAIISASAWKPGAPTVSASHCQNSRKRPGPGFSLRQTGPAALPMVLFEDDPDFRLGYAWCAAALRAGAYLSPYHNMFSNAAMTEADVTRTLEATGAAFEELRRTRESLLPPPQLAPRA